MNIHINSVTFHGKTTVRDKRKCTCMKDYKNDNKIT